MQRTATAPQKFEVFVIDSVERAPTLLSARQLAAWAVQQSDDAKLPTTRIAYEVNGSTCRAVYLVTGGYILSPNIPDCPVFVLTTRRTMPGHDSVATGRTELAYGPNGTLIEIWEYHPDRPDYRSLIFNPGDTWTGRDGSGPTLKVVHWDASTKELVMVYQDTSSQGQQTRLTLERLFANYRRVRD